jgi:Neuraminidase (sialidase)
MLYGRQAKLHLRESQDGGRSWGEEKLCRAEDGSPIALPRDTAHHSLVRLKSGKLGLLHGGPAARPGRDGTVLFRTSADEGRTWSAPTAVDPYFALCRNGSVRVLKGGRIIAPTFKWISSHAGPGSEEEDAGLVYSWVYYSDDEGKTWKRSLSEVYISLDGGTKGNYGFDEPVVEELRDGTVLMIGRTHFGRPYKSLSRDQGVSWSKPEPMPLASSVAPHTVARIPETGDLLLVWNQASTEECLTGLMRHRLSTAISTDGGKTWKHFRNLESLDDRARVEPPPPEPKVYLMRPWGYRQPADRQRYPHAPGCLRVSYPTVAFGKDREVTFAYDYGDGVDKFKGKHTTKVKIVTLDWLYGKE